MVKYIINLLMGKRKVITSGEESDITISKFHNSVSHFRKDEEKALRLKIHFVENFSEIVNETINSETNLELPEFDKGKIMTFSPAEHSTLEISQKKFLNKLKLVLINNSFLSDGSNFEKLIDDMMIFLYEYIGFDDGENITMKPCNLRLIIGDDSFAAHSDREGRRGTEVVWVMCEDKHIMSRNYKKGESQLIYCMIAAYQYNNNIFDGIYPPKMVGIRVVADKFYFYCIENPEEYIEDLFEGLPKRDLNIKKYPKDVGLSIADSGERKDILKYLYSIRDYALTLEAKY